MRDISLVSVLLILICIVNFHHCVESSALKFEPKPISSSPSNGKILACYYRPHRIEESLLPTNVCTHIIYSFANLTQSGIVPQHPADVVTYRALAKLKEKNPKLKILLSINAGFPSVVSFGTETMLRCSLSAVKFLKEHGFDGLDMDWEFPNILQKQAYSEFIMIVSTVLHWSNKTLSLAMPNSIGGLKQGYFTDTINKYTDFVTVMTYDFKSFSKTHNHTDFNSPLYAPKGDNPFASTAGALEFYLFLGVSPSKMLIGFPTYARTWELANASNHGVHAPAVGFGSPGPVTNLTGYYMFEDICTAQKLGGKVVRDTQDGAEYLYYGKTWVAFNGMYSVGLKTDWLAKKNLAGVGVWTFENDDPHNVCGLGPFPVLSKIRSRL